MPVIPEGESHAFAVAMPLVWLVWLALTEWVPVFPLNDLRPDNRRERLGDVAVSYPIPLLISAGIAAGHGASRVVALVLSRLVLAGHVASWWLPYYGVSTQAQRDSYARDYARTLKVLPTQGRSVVPDVQHMVVGLLTLLMTGATLAVTVRG
ncbi:hypothetical protein ACSHWO_01840 [Streptomyces sp. HUAS TT3]|uniref:hypothetical protein n=1 Tax=Streptomyces sp. HUAS TT3 TaxID=3447510 RepID=UPI003F657B3B